MKTHLQNISLTLLLLSGILANAQDSFKEKETYSFTINTQNSTIKFDVLANKETFHAEESLTYFWFSTNKILETRGGYDGKLLNGRYACFYMNSNLKEKGKFKKGLKDGEWISWYENGRMMEIVTWKCGLRNGPYRSFDETGHPVLEAMYKRGMLHGTMTTYVKGEVSSKREYRYDKELESKPVKVKKSKTKEKEPGSKQKSGKKRTLKERWNNLFKKKTKDQKDKPSPNESKPKDKKKLFPWLHNKKQGDTAPNPDKK